MKKKESITFSGRIEVQEAEWRLKFPGRLDLKFSIAPEFGGDASAFSPEDLFLSAVNSCYFLTFQRVAEDQRISFREYSSEARGEIDQVGGVYRFTKVVLQPCVKIEKEKIRKKIDRAFHTAHELCPVANALKIPVEVVPEIVVVGESHQQGTTEGSGVKKNT